LAVLHQPKDGSFNAFSQHLAGIFQGAFVYFYVAKTWDLFFLRYIEEKIILRKKILFQGNK